MLDSVNASRGPIALGTVLAILVVLATVDTGLPLVEQPLGWAQEGTRAVFAGLELPTGPASAARDAGGNVSAGSSVLLDWGR